MVDAKTLKFLHGVANAHPRKLYINSVAICLVCLASVSLLASSRFAVQCFDFLYLHSNNTNIIVAGNGEVAHLYLLPTVFPRPWKLLVSTLILINIWESMATSG